MHYKRLVMPNGMRVIFAPRKDDVAATVLVLVEAGSKYETKEINGLSHFLEHMCFKGTVKRPRAIQISSALDGLGAEYNAFTSQEWTGYFAKVEKNKAESALEIISDLYLNPVFDPGEIEKEKGVVIEEINMYEDLPPRKIHDLFMNLLYGDQPAGWDIAGSKEVIRRLSRDDFLKYRKEHYVAKATVIVVAGSFDEKRMEKLIKEHFVSIAIGKKTGKISTVESQSKPMMKMQEKKSDQTHLVIGCRAFSIEDPRRHELEVLSDVLGGGMSSRLFEKIRNELGAAYYVRADAELLSDHGYFAVAAGVDHSKIEVVVRAILEEMSRLANELIPEDELQRAKDHLTGRLLLGLETSDALATYYGGQEVLREEIITPEELIRKVRAVKAEDLRDLAKFIFLNSKLNLAIIGPKGSDSRLADILTF